MVKTLFALEHFIDDIHDQYLQDEVVLLAEGDEMVIDDRTEVLVLSDLINSNEKAVGYRDDGPIALNWLTCAHPNDAVRTGPEVRRVAHSWIDDGSVLPQPAFVLHVERRGLQL